VAADLEVVVPEVDTRVEGRWAEAPEVDIQAVGRWVVVPVADRSEAARGGDTQAEDKQAVVREVEGRWYSHSRWRLHLHSRSHLHWCSHWRWRWRLHWRSHWRAPESSRCHRAFAAWMFPNLYRRTSRDPGTYLEQPAHSTGFAAR